jgi:putative nucleotidyltransferase with HDIG domain
MMLNKSVQKNRAHTIVPAQICVGLFVHLDVGWMDHPFAFSNFKIQDNEQVAKIKSIGLKQLRYNPLRSDTKPLVINDQALTETSPIATAETLTVESNSSANIEENSPTFKEVRLIQLHQAIDENEKKFAAASHMAKEATQNFLVDPEASIAQGDVIIGEMVDVALTEGDIAIHAINGNQSDEDYQHSMNVLVLSLMMSKTLDLTKEEAKTLGVAALFHDIGKLKLDSTLLTKPNLSPTEQLTFETHSAHGAKLALEAGLSNHVSQIIHQHHELMDGSGYPNKLQGERIDPLARLVGLVSAYDDLCNPIVLENAKTPYEALAYLFANQRTQYDETILKRMIKTMGIYPPGSVVQLSTGVYANVISGNINHPLRPFVMLHETSKQNQKPTIIDLREEPNIHISICLRPNQLPTDVLAYFKPSKRVNFFLDAKLAQDMPSNSADLF